jgi:hypothetical protein
MGQSQRATGLGFRVERSAPSSFPPAQAAATSVIATSAGTTGAIGRPRPRRRRRITLLELTCLTDVSW